MAIVMNMSGYEIERDSAAAEEYSDEVMYAELIPQLAPVGDSHVAEVDKSSFISGELSNMDVDAFLREMYRYQR